MADILMEIPPHLVPYANRTPVGDLAIFYYSAGPAAAPPVLLLHGLGDEADTWRSQILPLARSNRVIAPDLPGFGRSSGPANGYSIAFFARTIIGLIAQLGLRRVSIVGSSLGAMVAQRISLSLPDLVAQQILIGGCLPVRRQPLPTPLLPLLAPGLGELAYTSLRRSQELAYTTLEPFYHNLYALPEADQQFLRRRVWARVWSHTQRRAFLSALRWLAIDGQLRHTQYLDRVGQCAVPTTIIHGDHDRIASGEQIEATEAALENRNPITIIPIDRCGHLPQQERPEELLAALQERIAPAPEPALRDESREPL